MVGTSFPYIEFYPKPGQARGGADRPRRPCASACATRSRSGLVGDSRADASRRLRPLLRPQPDRAFLESAQERMRDWRRLMEERGTPAGCLPMKPQVVAWELTGAPQQRDRALDSGTIATWGAPVEIPRASGQMHSARHPRQHGEWPALRHRRAGRVPRASGGGVRRRRRLLHADGGARHRVKYKLPVKVVVIKNNTLGQIKWEQMAFLATRSTAASSNIDRLRVYVAGPVAARGAYVSKLTRPTLSGSTPRRGPGEPRAQLSSRRLWTRSSRPCQPRLHVTQALNTSAESLLRGEPEPAEDRAHRVWRQGFAS